MATRNRAIRHVALAITLLAAPMIWLAPQATAAERNYCLAKEGVVLVQTGTATCVADGVGSVAEASGKHAHAEALDGDHNTARAIGDHSQAIAGTGNGNTAIAIGTETVAGAINGDDSTTYMSGNGNKGVVGGGGNNVRVTGHDNIVQAFLSEDLTLVIRGNNNFGNDSANRGSTLTIQGNDNVGLVGFGACCNKTLVVKGSQNCAAIDEFTQRLVVLGHGKTAGACFI